MKRLFCLGTAICLAAASFAQQSDEDGDRLVSAYMDVQWGGAGTPKATLACYALQSTLGTAACEVSVTGRTTPQTPRLNTRLVPGVPYDFVLISDNGFNPNGQYGTQNQGTKRFILHLSAPEGYVAEINQAVRESMTVPLNDNIQVNSLHVTVRLQPVDPNASLRAGMATSLSPGRTLWKLSLGSLPNGTPAGSLMFNDLPASTTLASMFTRTNVVTDASSSDVVLLGETPPNGLVIRQVIAPQVCVDLSGALSSGDVQMKCYHPSQRSVNPDASGYYTFTGDPFAWYMVQLQGSDAAGVVINCDLRDLPSATSVGLPVVRTLTTKLTRTGSSPSYTWTADASHTGTSAVTQIVRARSGNTETISAIEAGATALVSTRTYTSPLLQGEEITSEAAGTVNPVATSYDFYSADPQSAAYGKTKTVAVTGGGWQGFEYNTDGRVATAHGPYNNSDIGVPAGFPQHAGVKVGYGYNAVDRLGRLLVTNIDTSVNGTAVGKVTIEYLESLPFDAVQSGHPNLMIESATRTETTDASAASLTTVTRYFSAAVGVPEAWTSPPPLSDDFFRFQTYSIERSDRVKQSFVQQRGTWSGSSFTPSNNAGLDDGEASQVAVITGSSDPAAGTSYSNYGGYPVDPLYLISGKSTLEITVRDKYANIVHTEMQVWNGGWNVVSSMDYTYNLANELTARTASNGGVWSATYSGERVISETDESGVTLSYAYDAAGRVDTVTRAAAGNIAALTTKFTYEAAGHVTKQVVGYGGAETLVSSRSYDDAGRLTSESSPGPNGAITTGYSYNPASRQVTATLPNTGTRIETYQADGRLQQVTGTGVVSEYYTYDVQSDATLHAKVNVSTSTSSRLRETWSDWLGRTTKTSRPGFGGTSQPAFQEQAYYDGTTGRLAKTSRTGGLAPTLYQYDALSQLTRSGLDVGGTSDALDLDGTDRITDADQYFESVSNVWWLTRVAKTYPTGGSSTAQTVSIVRQRLFPSPSGNLHAETVSVDADGNITDRTVSVDRTTATTTVTTTLTAGISNSRIETSVDGFPTAVKGFDGLTTTIGYDALGRRSTVVDSRTGTSHTYYKPGSTFVDYVQDATGKNVATYTYDGAGRVTTVTDAENNSAYSSYNNFDQPVHQWGGGTYAVESAYDAYGQKIAQRTFHGTATNFTGASWPLSEHTFDSYGNPNPANWTGADKTTWTYDTPSGLLSAKTDAAGKAVSYTYNSRGQTDTRTWARHVGNDTAKPLLKTTYAYDPSTGELTGITYNDTAEPNPTSPVSYTYTRAGQLDTATDNVTGLRDFIYDPAQPLRLGAVGLSSFYNSRVLTRQYDGVFRPAGFKLGTTGNAAVDLTQTYVWNATTGRFDHLDSAVSAGTARTFTYGYEPNSSLVKTLTTGSLLVTRTFEAHRNLLTSTDSRWSGASRTTFAYTYNDRALRDSIKQSGSVFGDFGGSTYYRPLYNGRGELTDATDYLGEDASSTSSPQLSGRHFAYAYDNLGNRTSASRNGSAVTDDFVPNNLNQYSSRENNVAHAAGTAQAASVITASGTNGASFTTAGRQGRYWDLQATLSNTSGPASSTFTITATLPGSPTLVRTDATHTAYLPQRAQLFDYDEDGNLTGDGVWNYNYDAENRLISMTTTAGAIAGGFPNRTLEFKYDYLGRRVQKRSLSTTAGTDVYRRYLYDGDNLVAEFDATATTCGSPVRSYTWGLDLAGSLTATGGVGALVQIHDYAGSGTDYFPTFDGNGNIASLLKATDGTVAAAYEYSPFGELLRTEGSYAATNPFRFSTKFTDDESGLVYYGQRYYSPSLGRFINRDPIAEQGGLNLYGFAGNDGINGYDYLGLDPIVLPEMVVYGAKVGSTFGPVGTVVGAAVGAVASIFGLDHLFGGLFGGGGHAAPKPPNRAMAKTVSSNYRPQYTWNGNQYGYWSDGRWIDMSDSEFLPGIHTLDPITVTSTPLPSFTPALGGAASVGIGRQLASGARSFAGEITGATDFDYAVQNFRAGYPAAGASRLALSGIKAGLFVTGIGSFATRTAGAFESAVGEVGGLIARNTGARTWQAYERAVRGLYGETSFTARQYSAIVDGKLVNGVADNVVEIAGRRVAIEAKFVDNWASSIRNSSSAIGRQPWAIAEQARMLDQAKKYSAAFDRVIYHSNNPEFINYYTSVFQDAGISNVSFIFTK